MKPRSKGQLDPSDI
jgi:hypothetical protein